MIIIKNAMMPAKRLWLKVKKKNKQTREKGKEGSGG